MVGALPPSHSGNPQRVEAFAPSARRELPFSSGQAWSLNESLNLFLVRNVFATAYGVGALLCAVSDREGKLEHAFSLLNLEKDGRSLNPARLYGFCSLVWDHGTSL